MFCSRPGTMMDVISLHSCTSTGIDGDSRRSLHAAATATARESQWAPFINGERPRETRKKKKDNAPRLSACVMILKKTNVQTFNLINAAALKPPCRPHVRAPCRRRACRPGTTLGFVIFPSRGLLDPSSHVNPWFIITGV